VSPVRHSSNVVRQPGSSRGEILSATKIAGKARYKRYKPGALFQVQSSHPSQHIKRETLAPSVISSRPRDTSPYQQKPSQSIPVSKSSRMRLSDLLRRFVSHFSSSSSKPSAETKETKQPLPPSISSGTSLGKPTTETMPGLTNEPVKGKYNQIPGPLGLASASLEGKVALVTGAGMCFFLCLTLQQGQAPDGPVHFTPTPSPAPRLRLPHTPHPDTFILSHDFAPWHPLWDMKSFWRRDAIGSAPPGQLGVSPVMSRVWVEARNGPAQSPPPLLPGS